MKPVPPTRLCDDPAAPRLVRADLARATKVPAVAFDGARGLAALEAAIHAGAAPATPFASSAATGAGKSLAAAVAKGLLLGIVTVGVVVTMGGAEGPPKAPRVLSTTSVSEPHQTLPPSQVEAVEAAAALPEPQAREAPPPSPRAPAPTPVPVPASGASISGGRGPHASESSAAPLAMGGAPMPTAPPAPSGASQLQMEMENLVRLRAADPQQALALAEEGRRRFPGGLYAQEREVLAISALVHLGRRGEAEARARAFVAAYPRSHLVERVRELTGVGAKE